MENKLILYHASRETVEFPEIRIQRYNTCTLPPRNRRNQNDNILHYNPLKTYRI